MYINGYTAFNGTDENDFIRIHGNATISGGHGSDVMLADFGPLVEVTASSDVIDGDAFAGVWCDSTVRENVLVADNTVPNMTMLVQAMTGTSLAVQFTVAAGQTLTVDVDAAAGGIGNPGQTPTSLQFWGPDGSFLTEGQGSNTADGGAGSVSDADSYLSYTNTSSEDMIITVYVFDEFFLPFQADGQFLVNVSITGHAVDAAPVVAGQQTIDAGNGDDIIATGGESDLIDSGFGNDRIYAGSGDDTIEGSAGSDYIDGGSGFDAVDFRGSDVGVNVYLPSGVSQYGFAEGDVYVGIEALVGSEFHDAFIGDDADNYFSGNGGDDVMSGNGGNDVIDGGLGNDVLQGNMGDDLVIGFDGDDTIIVWMGHDTIQAGAGADLIFYDPTGGLSSFDGGSGRDNVDCHGSAPTALYVNLVSGRYSINGGVTAQMTGIECFVDTDGSTRLITAVTGDAAAGPNTYDLAGGNDLVTFSANTIVAVEIDLGAGDDRVIVRDSALDDGDILDGGSGIDSLDFRPTDLSQGGLYAAITIDLAGGLVTADGEAENAIGFENAYGSIAAETILGTSGANILSGGGGNDTLEADSGDDTLLGGGGDDRLRGGAGDDRLDGGKGSFDLLEGGAGDDTYVIYDSGDIVYETSGEGTDTVVASYDYTLVANLENLTLSGPLGLSGTGNGLANTIRGTEAGDTLSGGAGDDTLFGNGGDDSLFGGIGVDTLRGGDGADVLRGGAGDDKVYGGAGIDRLYGEAGMDVFNFAAGDTGTSAATADTIADFLHSEGDRINLSAIDANTLLAADQKFAFVGTAAFSHTAGELRYNTAGAFTVIEGDTDGDGMADMVIKLTGAMTLVASDFVF